MLGTAFKELEILSTAVLKESMIDFKMNKLHSIVSFKMC